MKYKILFAGCGDENRTKTSGYEHITEFRDCDYRKYHLKASEVPFGFIPTGRRGKRLNLYFLELTGRMIADQYDLIHNYTCDDQMLFRFPRNRSYAAVATSHLNYHEFSRHQLCVLRSYDKVIVLNSREKEWMRKRDIDAEYIPHGFSRPVYKHSSFYQEKYQDKINVCFSGVCYRDYRRLLLFISFIDGRDDVRLHILGQRENIKCMLRKKSISNIVVYDHLTDDDYYSVISMCDYNFLPLTFASANNTLLEAEFLGIRSIVPRMEGIMDYAAREDNLFFSSNDELRDIVKHLRKEEKSLSVMKYAQRFSWSHIYRETKKVYEESMRKHGLC